MHACRIIAVSLVVTIGPSSAFAVVGTTISYRIRGMADAASDAFPDARETINVAQSNTKPNLNTHAISTLENRTVSSVHGDADIQVGVGAHAGFVPEDGRVKIGAGFVAELGAANSEPTLTPNQPPPPLPPVHYIQYARAELFEVTVKASWTDTLTFRSGLPDGTGVTVLGVLAFDEFREELTTVVAGTDKNRFGIAEAWVTLSGRPGVLPTPTIGQYFGYSRDDGVNPDILHIPPPFIPVTLLFVEGQTYDLGLTLEVGGKGFASRETSGVGTLPAAGIVSEMTADFSRTVTWAGITSVINTLTGEPIEDWTIVAESGYDYSKPLVPEPTSVVLLSFGLCAGFGWLRQQRRRATA
jgi:hypothetical protein